MQFPNSEIPHGRKYSERAAVCTLQTGGYELIQSNQHNLVVTAMPRSPTAGNLNERP